jgi:hypothetical protein
VTSYRTLSPDLIVKTLDRLHNRIEERFPRRGLGAVAGELLEVAQKDRDQALDFLRPYISVRVAVFLLIVVGIAAQLAIVASVWDRLRVNWDLFGVFQGLDAAMNTLLLAGAVIYFLTSLEARIKRRRALRGLHELRSVAHVIDMHQLTKDPPSILIPGARTKSSPIREMTAFELSRYLDYCSEMLALTGKLAALYAQNTRDPVVIQGVNEIEALTTALSGKIWQKIMIMRGDVADDARTATPVPQPPRAPVPAG